MTVPYMRNLSGGLINHCGLGFMFLQKYLKQSLTFPHSQLELSLKLYQDYGGNRFIYIETVNCLNSSLLISASPLSETLSKQYRRCCELYQKIVDSEDDDECWLQALIETDDTEFIKQNVELRLGKMPCNKNLWHLFLNFLSSRNDEVPFSSIRNSELRLENGRPPNSRFFSGVTVFDSQTPPSLLLIHIFRLF